MSNQATQKPAQSAAGTTPSPIEEILIATEKLYNLSAGSQFDLLRALFPTLDNGELSILMQAARERNLSPFRREIYGIKYDGKHLSIVVGIDGFRLQAARTGQHTGTDEAIYEYDETLKDDTNPAGILLAKTTVYRSGHAFVGVARWKEFVGLKEGKANGNWKQRPHVMIAKCAEAQALRKGFPEGLSGLVAPEEMDHVTNLAVAVETAEQVKIEAMLLEAFERASSLGALRDAEAVFKQQEKALLAHQRVRIRAKANAARAKAEAARLRAEREKQAPRAPIETGAAPAASAPAPATREPGAD